MELHRGEAYDVRSYRLAPWIISQHTEHIAPSMELIVIMPTRALANSCSNYFTSGLKKNCTKQSHENKLLRTYITQDVKHTCLIVTCHRPESGGPLEEAVHAVQIQHVHSIFQFHLRPRRQRVILKHYTPKTAATAVYCNGERNEIVTHNSHPVHNTTLHLEQYNVKIHYK